MFEFTTTTKNCATCIHWGGARTTNVSKPGSAFVDSQGVHGKCFCASSQYSTAKVSGQGPQANYTCSYWQKWGALK